MVSHSMLQDHEFKHLLGFWLEEFTLVDEGCNVGIQDMDTFIGELVDIQEEFILEVPEVVIGHDWCPNSI